MRKILITCAAALALAACDDAEPAGPQPITSGSATFNIPAFGGQPAGTFNASGAVELDSLGTWDLGDWAYAEVVLDLNWPVLVMASMPAGDGRYHYMRMRIARKARAGDVLTIQPECQHSDVACAEFLVLTGMPANQGQPLGKCDSETGTVRLTVRDNRRIAGNFSVPVTCGLTAGGVTTTAPVTGSFDVPMVAIPRPPWAG